MQDVALAPQASLLAVRAFLGSAIRLSCAAVVVEEGTVRAMCSQLERLKAHACLSFVLLSLSPGVGKHSLVRMVHAAKGGSVRLMLRSSLPILRYLRSSGDTRCSVKHCVPTLGQDLWRCAGYDEAPAQGPLSTMFSAAVKALLELDGKAVQRHLVEASQRDLEVEMGLHVRWLEHLNRFCQGQAPYLGHTLLCLQAPEMDIVHDVVLQQHSAHVLGTGGTQLYAVCVVEADSATAQAAIHDAKVTAAAVGRLVVCITGAQAISPAHRKELVAQATSSGVVCVLCSCVADPEDYCDERCGRPLLVGISPMLLAQPTRAALECSGTVRAGAATGSVRTSITFIVYRTAQLVLGGHLSLRSLDAWLFDDPIWYAGQYTAPQRLKDAAASIVEATDFAIDSSLVEVVLVTLHKYYHRESTVPQRAPVLSSDLPPHKFLEVLVMLLGGHHSVYSS